MLVLQENAVKANECLNNAFGCDEFGNILFPDDFSGARIEDELLVISLIDISPESVAKYIDWAGDYSEYIIFEEVDYSYNYLQSCAIEIVNELSRDGMNIVGCSI